MTTDTDAKMSTDTTWMTIQQASNAYNIPVATIYSAIRRGVIRTQKPEKGGKLVCVADLAQLRSYTKTAEGAGATQQGSKRRRQRPTQASRSTVAQAVARNSSAEDPAESTATASHTSQQMNVVEETAPLKATADDATLAEEKDVEASGVDAQASSDALTTSWQHT